MLRNIFVNRNLSINQLFLFLHKIEFLILYEFVHFYKLFKCLFNKNSRKSTENFCEKWDITETNNWIKLLIFGDRSSFLFSQPVPKQLISLL